MEKSISKLRIAERKKVIVKRIEHKELEILERSLLNEEA